MNTDAQKSMAFARRVGKSLEGHVEILLAIIGDKQGFFKDLATNGPGTSNELALRNKVNERYLREWLNSMVAAKYLSLDTSTSTYSIPPENIPVLVQEYGQLSMGGMLNMIGSAEKVLPTLMQCFQTGGGVPYSEYEPQFWQGLERHTGCNFENHLLPSWIGLLDPVVEEKLKKGVRVCDVGCGNGRALLKLSKAYPNSTFIGYDIMEHAVQEGSRKAQEAGLNNLSFTKISNTQDKLPSSELFDIIFVFDVVHDSKDPLALLKCIRASIRDDGILACLDIKCSDKVEENSVFAYGMSLLYCMTTSLHQGGVGLGTLGLTESVMRKLCTDAGFKGSVKRLEVSSPFNVLWEVRPMISNSML